MLCISRCTQYHIFVIMRRFFFLLLAAWFCILLPARAMPGDSVITIQSYYAQQPLVQATRFATTPNGDTTVMLYVSRISRTNIPFQDDSLLLRVRMWNSQSGATLPTRDYRSIQPDRASNLYNLLPINGVPRLFYAPDSTTLDIMSISDGKRVQHCNFSHTILSLSWSPDNLHTFVTTDNGKYYIVDNRSGATVLSDSTYDYIQDNRRYHSNAQCAQIDWTLDNSLAMITLNEFIDTVGGRGENLFFKSTWRPFDVKNRSYLAKTFPKLNGPGNWLPNGRSFMFINLGKLSITALSGTKKEVATGKQIIGHQWVDGTPYVMILDYNNSISKWNIDSAKKVSDFTVDNLQGFCFSPDAKALAYVDNGALTLINTETNQGIHRVTLNFPYKIVWSDKRSLQLLNGNNAIMVRDSNNRFRFVNLNTGQVMVTLDSTDDWQVSPDGTALFTLGRKIERYDLFNGKKTSVFPAHDVADEVVDIAFHPSGIELANIDSTMLHIWNTKNGNLLRERSYAHLQKVYWSPDSSIIYLLRSDTAKSNYLTAVNATSLDTLFHIKPASGWMRFHGFSPDGKYALTTEQSKAIIYNLRNGQLVHEVKNDSPLLSASWSEDSRRIGTGDSAGYGKIIFWEKDSVALRYNANYTVHYLRMDASMNYAVCRSDSMTVLLSTKDGKILQYFTRATDRTTFIGDSIFVAVYDELFVESLLAGGDLLQFLTTTPAYFNGWGDYYATGGADILDTIRVVSYDTHKLHSALPGIRSRNAMIWTENSSTLAYTDALNNIFIWSPTGMVHKPRKTTGVELEAEEPMLSTYPNPAQQYLTISALEQRGIRSISIWDAVGNRLFAVELNSQANNSAQQGIDVSSLPQGYYSAEVQMENGKRIRKGFMILR